MTVSRRNFMRAAAVAPVALAGPSVLSVVSEARAADGREGQEAFFQRRMIGDIEVTALMDGFLQRPPEMVPGYVETEAREAARLAHRPHDPEALTIGINGYVIRTPERVVVVDTGSPAGLAPTLGLWHTALAAAGFAADQIDTVFLTHLHPDHVGGLTDPETQTRRLPNAHIIASEGDWAFTFDDALYAAATKEVQGGFDITRLIVRPYEDAKTLITPGAEIAPGLTTVPTFGHTPGHMALRVDSGGESLLIWGDVLIAPTYQFAHPEWGFALDNDKDAAAATRAKVLDMVATDGTMVAGMHLDFPGFGYVERAKQGYGFVAAPWDYRS